MKILNNYNIKINNQIKDVKCYTNGNCFYFKQNSLSADTFVRNHPNFTGINNSEFKDLGLELSVVTKKDIDPFVEHLRSNDYPYEAAMDSKTEKIIRADLKDIVKKKKGSAVLLKDSEGKIVGSGSIKYVKDPSYHNMLHGDISKIFIVPKWQNKGIGTKIMKNLIESGRQNNCTYLALLAKNPIAINIYKKLGFEEYKKTEDHIGMLMLLKKAPLH